MDNFALVVGLTRGKTEIAGKIMQDDFRRFVIPERRMGDIDLFNEYKRLDSLLRSPRSNPVAVADSMGLLMQHDGGTERSIKALERTLTFLLKNAGEAAFRHIETLKASTTEGGHLYQICEEAQRQCQKQGENPEPRNS